MTPVDSIPAERHGIERSQREYPTFLNNYSSPTAPFCPARPNLAPRTTATKGSREDQTGQSAISRTSHTSPVLGSSTVHGAISPAASSPSGSYFSTVLTSSTCPDEMGVDSPPAMQRSSGTRPEGRSSSPARQASSKEKNYMAA